MVIAMDEAELLPNSSPQWDISIPSPSMIIMHTSSPLVIVFIEPLHRIIYMHALTNTFKLASNPSWFPSKYELLIKEKQNKIKFQDK